MESKNSMKAKQGRRPNAHPTILGFDTLGEKRISGHFSNAVGHKEGDHLKHGSENVGFGHKHHKNVGFEGKPPLHKAIGGLRKSGK